MFLFCISWLLFMLFFVYLNFFKVLMMHWMCSFSLDKGFFPFFNDKGMSWSQKAFPQRPYFMVIFCNETSEIDKENFRIVFLKKSKELIQKLLNKMMMLILIMYIIVSFKRLQRDKLKRCFSFIILSRYICCVFKSESSTWFVFFLFWCYTFVSFFSGYKYQRRRIVKKCSFS